MIQIIKQSIRFIVFLLVQLCVLNNLEIGLGIQFMIYPLFIFMLPLELNIFVIMLISFLLGYIIDLFSNTYGLHASAAVFLAYIRPYLLNVFEPRDGYGVNANLAINSMGLSWFLYVFGLFLSIHFSWFFIMEQFNFNDFWFLIMKVFLSALSSISLCIVIQYTFLNKSDSR
jgi:hypothetical protein